jgi:protein AFG1
VVRAEATPETMFFPDALTTTAPGMADDNDSIMAAEALSETLHEAPRPNISVYNPSTITQRERAEASDRANSFSVLSIFTGEDERFAYVRRTTGAQGHGS